MSKTVTKFNVPCYFAGKKSQVAIYIGEPEQTHHPIFFQAKFIQDERGGVIPQEIMDSLSKLKQLAQENGVPFEELCRYALASLSGNSDANGSEADSSASVSASEADNSISAVPEASSQPAQEITQEIHADTTSVSSATPDSTTSIVVVPQTQTTDITEAALKETPMPQEQIT